MLGNDSLISTKNLPVQSITASSDDHQPVTKIHSDVLEIIFQFLPNFFLLSPPVVAMWRKVFKSNGSDEKIADRLIQQIVLNRFLNVKVLQGLTTLDLLSEIVSADTNPQMIVRKDRIGANPQMIVGKLGITTDVNEWASLFERLWLYCSCGEKYPQNPQKLPLDLKQLLMVSELVSRFSSIICNRILHQQGLELVDLDVDSPLEISLLYFEDEKCEFYKQSIVYKCLLPNDKWGVDFSETSVRIRGELVRRNNRIEFDPYLNWFCKPTESKQILMKGAENYLRDLKSNGTLQLDEIEDFLQRYWFKACVRESELFYSYAKNESCSHVLFLINTTNGRIARAEGNVNEFFSLNLPQFFRPKRFGRAVFSKCNISLKPKTNYINAQIYPESIYEVISAIGGRAIITGILLWNDWFFNWKYSRQFFQANNFSIWEKVSFIALDVLTTFGYPFKALYSLYHGFWLHQHVTLLESFSYAALFLSYLDLFKYVYSFRFTHQTWEGSYFKKPNIYEWLNKELE